MSAGKLLALAGLIVLTPAWAQAHPMRWTTLGTAAGAAVHAGRSQPANLLGVGDALWLVDCGDGCVERLAAAGAQASRVSAVFVSHLHVDHIGGLQGLIGLRWMQNAPGVLTVYGPPGIDKVVDGVVASLEPATKIGFDSKAAAPRDTVRVVIVRDGADLSVGGVRVRAVRNTHFDESGHAPDNGTQSLSYRFDYGGEGIGYTGDTGPSPAVAALFRGADLMVSEVIDLPAVAAKIDGPTSNTPPPFRAGLIAHLKSQHLSPQDAGRIAAAAGVKRLVFTHLSIIGETDAVAPGLIAAAHQTYAGEVAVAHDLDSF